MKLLILISTLTLVSGQQWGTAVNQCVQNNGLLPVVVEIPGCVTPPCTVTTDETTNFNILFRTPHNTTTLRTRAVVFLGFIPLNYDLGYAGDTCSNLLSGRCPAGEGALLLHRLSLFLDSTFPSIQVPTEISIVDENNNSVACFRVILRIEHPVQKLDVPNVPQIK